MINIVDEGVKETSDSSGDNLYDLNSSGNEDDIGEGGAFSKQNLAKLANKKP
jgi:hypothetical protein